MIYHQTTTVDEKVAEKPRGFDFQNSSQTQSFIWVTVAAIRQIAD